jgi:hypothetical protein
MPDLDIPGITGIVYAADRLEAAITADADVRDAICDALAEHGIRLRGIERARLSLEEIFLSYYQQAG